MYCILFQHTAANTIGAFTFADGLLTARVLLIGAGGGT